MLELTTVDFQKGLFSPAFYTYLLSDLTVKKTLREYAFYNVRFMKAERIPDVEIQFEYPKGDLFWYVDFKNTVQKEIIPKSPGYEKEWNLFLEVLKYRVQDQYKLQTDIMDRITNKDVVNAMHEYSLRDYQALDMLQLRIKMESTHAGLILSEQRSGKTRVAIATMLSAFKEYVKSNVIIVCPKSAVLGWQREIDAVNWYMINSPISCRLVSKMSELKSVDTVKSINASIITYDLFKRFTSKQLKKAFCPDEKLPTFLIIDEAHRLRNFNTMQSKALFDFKQFCLRHKINMWLLGLTGTPAIKQSSDIFGLLCFVNMSRMALSPYVKDFNTFAEYFYTCYDSNYGKVCKALKRAESLKFLVGSCSVQTKQRDLDMFKDYKKKYIKRVLKMDPEQEEIYKSVSETFEYGDEIDCQNKLVQLTRLQQICTDPSGLVASYGGVAPKIKWMLEYAKHVSGKAKTIVMSKKVQPLMTLRDQLWSQGYKLAYLIGSTPLKKRIEEVDKFRENDDVRFILIQSDIGRESWTLPEASYTIFLDRDFAQGYNEQAESRMTPIDGAPQTKCVVDLLMESTVEEGIYDTLVIRKESIDNVNTLAEIYRKGGLC